MIALRKWGRMPDFEAVIARFPVAVMCVGLMTLIAMFGDTFFDEWMAGIWGGLILGAYLSVGIQLAAESAERTSWRWLAALKIAVAAAAIALGGLYEALAFFVPVAILAAILALGNFAHFRRSRHDASVWVFTQKLWTGAIFAFIGSIVFALGILAITQTVKVLFGLSLDGLAEHLIYPIGLAFLAPVYWMGTLPHPREVPDADEVDLPEISFEARILAFLGTWILAPLVLIYALIILAYIARSLLTMSLPEGEIATLVAPFIGVGTLTWLMLEPKVLREGGFVRFYRKVWFPVMVLASLLLLLAIAIRIGAYGFTAERFSILAIGVAGLITSVWFTVRAGARDIRIPTAMAAFAALTIAFLAKPVSDLSQLARLEAAIEASASPESHTTIRSTVSYLDRADRDDWLREIFPDAPENNVYWPGYVEELGYTQRSPDMDSQQWRNVNFQIAEDIDLSVTPKLVGTRSIFVHGEPDPDGRNVPYAHACGADETIVMEANAICLLVDGRNATVPYDESAGDLYRKHYSGVYDNRKPREDLPVAPSYSFELPDGRSARLVIYELGLNGEGERLTGGYGEALLFTE